MILIPIATAMIVPWTSRLLRGYAALLAAIVPLGVGAAIAALMPTGSEPVRVEVLPWISEWGIALAFRLDGLSATFGLLICGIGAFVLLYAGGYMHDDPRLGRLCGLLLMFLGAMLGVVFSDDLIVLFVFWELTSVASYLLIGFKHDKQDARDAARTALLVTGGGGLVLLAGVVLLTMAGSGAGLPLDQASRISALARTDLSGHAMFTPALLLIVVGAFSKSAQMPLHFWLPRAMTAPTPVSAYLHSATMVKAGVFLLARLNPVFGESLLWHLTLTSTGAVTMLVAAGMAAGQTDLKRILAYTTVSVLGTLTMLIGVGTELALKAAVVYLVAHACYKAALFMIAGSLEYATGTRDIRRLGGLAKTMPLTAISGALAALSMAGAPPLFGFIGKELLLKAKLDLASLGVVLILVASAANVLLIAMALVVAAWPFFGRRGEAVGSVRRVPARMLIGPIVLATAGLFVGMIPGLFDRTLGSAMATAIAGYPIVMELKLWHGLSPTALTALGISAATLTLGFMLFLRLRTWLAPIAAAVGRLGQRGAARMYDLAYAGMLVLADRVTTWTATRGLRHYVRIVLIAMIAACAYPLSQCFGFTRELLADVVWYEVVLVLLAGAGTVTALRLRSNLSVIALLGITGLLIAILFSLFGAPDLAITQIMVEALTVILLVLVFFRLPAARALRSRGERLFDATIAMAAGAVLAGLVLASYSVELPATVSDQLAHMSKPEAYGRNVVNVILVDFRALDTLGEVTVVAMAGLGAYMLLTHRGRGAGGGS